jgi:hypothetical protein
MNYPSQLKGLLRLAIPKAQPGIDTSFTSQFSIETLRSQPTKPRQREQLRQLELKLLKARQKRAEQQVKLRLGGASRSVETHSETYKSEHKAACSIQAAVRGFLTREKCSVLITQRLVNLVALNIRTLKEEGQRLNLNVGLAAAFVSY